MSVYAFIFARGGSKGLPRKNIKVLAGKPLIVHSIEAAFLSPEIAKVFVSTDDAEIARISESAGAEIILRPNELASDTSSEWLSWVHAINYVEAKYGEFTEFVSLPATSPLRSVDDINATLVKRREEEADICITVSESSRSPYFNMVVVAPSGNVSLVLPPEEKVSRRQDAPVVYDITTVAYTARTQFIKEKRSIFDGKLCSVLIPKERAVDIDDIYDFIQAEAILSYKGDFNA